VQILQYQEQKEFENKFGWEVLYYLLYEIIDFKYTLWEIIPYQYYSYLQLYTFYRLELEESIKL